MTIQSREEIRIALVGEFPPPAAGMGVQARALMCGLRDAGVAVYPVPVNRHFKAGWPFINRVRGVRGFLRFTAFLIGTRCFRDADIVHVFSASGLNYYLFSTTSLLLAGRLRKPCVIHYHGGAAARFFAGHQRLLDWSMRRAASLVVPSAYLAKVFADFGQPAKIIPNVAGVERFRYRERVQSPPRIVMARNLTPTYNVACGIRAFAALAEVFPEATLTIAGDGPERACLERLVSELGLRHVSFLGSVANERMPQVYEQASLFLNTSNVDNMPGSILEAYACGLPVVSTDAGGIPYLVEHGATGLLAPVNDHSALAKQLIRVAGDPAFAQRLARAGYARVTELTAQRISQAWLEHYRQLLSDGR